MGCTALVSATMGGMGVHDEGDEPDPRFTLANERTFLAWVRTTLAMLAGAVALHSLGFPTTDWLRNASSTPRPRTCSGGNFYLAGQ